MWTERDIDETESKVRLFFFLSFSSDTMSGTRLFFTLSLLLLSVTPAESPVVVGHEPVQASAGEDVVLPCHLEPPTDVSTLTVEWTRDDLTVHLYRNRKHDHPQDEQFRGRTSLFHSELIRGNISLKLSNVKKEDSGLYSCYVPRLESPVKTGNVLLTVEFSDVVGDGVQASAGEDVVLPCLLEPPFDVSELTVEWTRDHLTVHLYRDTYDDYEDQDKQFRGRTSLFHSELSRGNISLKLTNVTEEDSGLYFYYVPRLESQIKKGYVLLTVDPQKNPAGTGGNDETKDDDKQSGGQRGVVVGIVVGGFFVILVLTGITVYYYRCRGTIL